MLYRLLIILFISNAFAIEIQDIEYEITKYEEKLKDKDLNLEKTLQIVGIKNFYKFLLSDDFKNRRNCTRKWQKLKIRYPHWQKNPEPYLKKGLEVFSELCPGQIKSNETSET